jgi:hypothetical protein
VIAPQDWQIKTRSALVMAARIGHCRDSREPDAPIAPSPNQ